MFTFDWKTFAVLGASAIGIILACKVDKTEAKSALENFTSVAFSPIKVVNKIEG